MYPMNASRVDAARPAHRRRSDSPDQGESPLQTCCPQSGCPGRRWVQTRQRSGEIWFVPSAGPPVPRLGATATGQVAKSARSADAPPGAVPVAHRWGQRAQRLMWMPEDPPSLRSIASTHNRRALPPDVDNRGRFAQRGCPRQPGMFSTSEIEKPVLPRGRFATSCLLIPRADATHVRDGSAWSSRRNLGNPSQSQVEEGTEQQQSKIF